MPSYTHKDTQVPDISARFPATAKDDLGCTIVIWLDGIYAPFLLPIKLYRTSKINDFRENSSYVPY